MRIVITGAGGFIGSHLARRLTSEGHDVFGLDIKEPEHWEGWEELFFKEFHRRDLRDKAAIHEALRHFSKSCGPIDRLYHLAANMGGIGFIESHKGEIVRDNTEINLNTLNAAIEAKVGRFLFTSSACVYPGYKQGETDVTPLKETDAYPADAEDGYGWEKLYTERLCRHYQQDFGLKTRVVRFHNVFGPNGTWDGGREKAPAAICRKVALAEEDGQIEIWGDGNQTRSFLYIDDCLDGLVAIMESKWSNPLNLGQDRLITINELVSIVEGIANKKLRHVHQFGAPQGVRGRNSDNTLVTNVTGWTPKISLEEGLAETYKFIKQAIAKQHDE